MKQLDPFKKYVQTSITTYTMKELINEVGGKRCQHPGCRVTDEEDTIGCMHLTWVSCTNAYPQY